MRSVINEPIKPRPLIRNYFNPRLRGQRERDLSTIRYYAGTRLFRAYSPSIYTRGVSASIFHQVHVDRRDDSHVSSDGKFGCVYWSFWISIRDGKDLWILWRNDWRIFKKIIRGRWLVQLCIKVKQNFNQNLELIQIFKKTHINYSVLKNVSFLIVSFRRYIYTRFWCAVIESRNFSIIWCDSWRKWRWNDDDVSFAELRNIAARFRETLKGSEKLITQISSVILLVSSL